jgi:murein DD-endopeptidase MepM/ murein hydrolase activator NlpD
MNGNIDATLCINEIVTMSDCSGTDIFHGVLRTLGRSITKSFSAIRGRSPLQGWQLCVLLCFLPVSLATAVSTDFATVLKGAYQVVEGAISTLGEIDEFTFDASAGDSALIRVAETSWRTEPYVWLYNPDGTLLTSVSDNEVAVLNCQPTSDNCRLQQTGTYRLLVMDYGDDDTGGYAIHYVRPAETNQGGSLMPDEVMNGSLTLGDIDSYVFDASAGDSALIRVAETSWRTEPYVWLYNPDGTLLTSVSDNEVAVLNCQPTSDNCRLQQTGTYRLLVMDYGDDDTGGYAIHYVRPAETNQGGSLMPDEVMNGSLTLGDIDSYVFDASAGDSALIRVAETSWRTEPYVWLYNPDGTLLTSVSDNEVAVLNCQPTSDNCRLQQTGTYRLLVMDYGDDDTGGYAITFVGAWQPRFPLSPTAGFPQVTQDYSCRGTYNLVWGEDDGTCFSTNSYHTGLDLIPRGTDFSVYAVDGGTVVSAVASCGNHDSDCNHGFGNAVIIRHQPDLYTLYAHLAPSSVTVGSGDDVEPGQYLAEMGSTGNVTGTHLHFEAKRESGLGEYGYTPTPPGNYGYLDPWLYLPGVSLEPMPIEVVNDLGVFVRRGPSTDYAAFTELAAGQHFVAFARLNNDDDVWYRIYVPCGNSNSCAGWIAGRVGSKTYSKIDNSALVFSVTGTETKGLNVRNEPGGSILDKIYDGQRFVYDDKLPPSDDCASDWYQINLPSLSSKSEWGWVCSDYADADPEPEETIQAYHSKVRAYFHGVLGRAPDTEELDAWSTVLFDNKGSVWRPTGDGLQRHLSDLVGWGSEIPSDAETRALIETVLTQLFGSVSSLDRRISDYYVGQLRGGHIRPRGLVNAVLNDLAIMPRVDGSYGKPNGWTGGPGEGLLTQTQIDTYRSLIAVKKAHNAFPDY